LTPTTSKASFVQRIARCTVPSPGSGTASSSRIADGAPTGPARTNRGREAPIDRLTPKQRAHLRSLAHPLKPVLQIGKEGVTDQAVSAIADAFSTRELLKVKVQEAGPMSAAAVGESLATRIEGCHHVQTIGRTVVLYRPHPENPRIGL
jgi:RNA-binding protein